MKAPSGVRALALAMVLSPGTLRAEVQSLIDRGIEKRYVQAQSRLSDYHALVRRYRANDREPSLRALDSWTDQQLGRLREDLAALRRTLLSGRRPSARWDVVDMRAAVVMQTERALVYVYNPPTGHLPGIRADHLDMARRLLEVVDPEHDGWSEFRLEWWRWVIPWIYRHSDREGGVTRSTR